MSILGKYKKQPAEVESYTIRYDQDLTFGDEITEASASVIPAGELEITGIDVAVDSVRVWLSGGNDGNKYKIEVTSNTSDGRVMQDEFYVTIRDY